MRFSMPMFIAVVFAWVLNMTDRIFIANLANYADAGIYSLASKIVQFAIIFIGALAQAYSPYFYRIANSYSYEDAQKLLRPVCNVYTGVICFLFIVVTFLSKPILCILFDSSFLNAIYFVYFLAVSGIFSQQSSLLNLMVYQNKKVVAMSSVGIICGALSVFLNILLIPQYGAIAAGFSNLVVGFMIYFLSHYLARKNYYIPYGYFFAYYSVLFILMGFLFDVSGVNLFVALICKIICSLVLIYAAIKLKIIDKKDYVLAYNKVVIPFINKVL